MKLTKLVIICLTTLFSLACTIHRVDVQQGNIIKPEQLEQLKPGISKRQVRFIMGTPLIQDPFHSDRWDYVYTLQPGHLRKITERQRVTIYFEGDKLVKIDKKMNENLTKAKKE